MKLLLVSGGSNRFTKNADFNKYIFSSEAKMTGFKVMEKPKSCCSSKQIRIWWSLKFDEKYRLSSKTPKRKSRRVFGGIFFLYYMLISLTRHSPLPPS